MRGIADGISVDAGGDGGERLRSRSVVQAVLKPVMCTNDMLKRVVRSKFQARLVARRELLGLDVHARGRVDRADSVNDATAGMKAFRHCLVV